MLNQKELTQSVFDLFEKVRRQAAAYNEAFQKLDYNLSVFDKLVAELSEIDASIQAEKVTFVQDLQSQLERAVYALEQEKKTLLLELAKTENLHELITKYNTEFDAQNVRLQKQQALFDEFNRKLTHAGKSVRADADEINSLKEQYNEELVQLKNSTNTLLKRQLDKLEQQFKTTVHDQYRELEIFINNRQMIFEKRVLDHYDKLEGEVFNIPLNFANNFADMNSKINIVDNLVTNKIANDDTYKREINTRLQEYKKEMSNFSITFSELNGLDPVVLDDISKAYSSSNLIQKKDISKVISKATEALSDQIEKSNKKNIVAISLSVICLLAILMMIILG